MTAADFISGRLAELNAFMVDPQRTVLRLAVDPELRRLPLKYLAGKDQDPSFPHVLIADSRPFVEPLEWFQGLLDMFEDELERHGPELAASGVPIWRPRPDRVPGMRSPERFLVTAEAFAHALPDEIGSLVFVLDPEAIVQPDAFRRSIRFLADQVGSPWLKVIVLEPRLAPVLDELVDHPRVKTLVFWQSPDQLEARADGLLAQLGPRPSPERRTALATSGAMAFARKDYAVAAQRQDALAAEAALFGTPVEEATARYNLGNTFLADGKTAEAIATFTRTCALCCDYGLLQLSPMAYTNLGVALYREGDFDQAFASLKVARDQFRCQGNRPGEAHVCDTLAMIYQELGRSPGAEQAWRYALKLYEGITNPTLADVRAGGSADILAKLDRLTRASDDASV